MSFMLPQRVDQQELAVVYISSEYLSYLISTDEYYVKANHGVRDIHVHSFVFDITRNVLCALISSADIPDYVAYHNIMEDLKYHELYGNLFPVVALTFAIGEKEKEDCDEQEMREGDL